MKRPSPLPAPLDGLPFSRREALSAGLSDGRLRRADLVAPFHGARLAADAPIHHALLCAAFATRTKPGFAFSHLTAARIYGAPLPMHHTVDLPLHVCVQAGGRAPGPAGAVGHRVILAAGDLTEFAFSDPLTGSLYLFPVVSPALMLAQVAAVLDLEDVVAVADYLLGGEVPMCTPEQLNEVGMRYVGRPGARRLAAALALTRVGSRSRPESLLRLQIVRSGLPEPLINAAVHDHAGRELGEPDGHWPDYRVLYEYEGDHHRRSRGRFRQDISRIEAYQDGGWVCARIHAGDVFDAPDPMLARLWRLLVAAGWTPNRREVRKVAALRR